MTATVDSSTTQKRRERNANDWYVEPAWSVEGLLDVQCFSGYTLDPACGRGNIVSTFKARGLRCVGTDIVNRAPHLFTFDSVDFLDPRQHTAADNVVSNPPFDLAEEFLRRALDLARHKVAFLLRLSWLEGRRRRWIHDETPLAAVHPFAARVSMPPGGRDIVAKGGAVAFAWYVWDHSHKIGSPPILRRIERGPK